MKKEEYIIRGGEYGADRLLILSETLWPYTERLLIDAGLREGCKFLDVGCGSGGVTIEVAKFVGSGRFVGLDFDEKVLERARQAARENGVEAEFVKCDLTAEEIPERDFDIAYARFIFTHLKDRNALASKLFETLGTGGKLVVEDIDFSGHFSHPQNDAFDNYVDWYQKISFRKGIDPFIGPKLFEDLKNAGFSKIELDVINPAHQSGIGKMMGVLTLNNIAPGLIDSGIASEEEVLKTSSELEEFTYREDSILGMPRIFRYVAVKKV